MAAVPNVDNSTVYQYFYDLNDFQINYETLTHTTNETALWVMNFCSMLEIQGLQEINTTNLISHFTSQIHTLHTNIHIKRRDLKVC